MTNYPTNVSNSQWQYISKFLDVSKKRKHSLREVFNAILYIVKTGSQWRMMPGDFPKWQLVCYYFSVWKKAGLIEELHGWLVEKTRRDAGRKEEPTVGIIDSQPVKSTLVTCEREQRVRCGKENKGYKAAYSG